MSNNRTSIDGFIPRRPGAQLGDLRQNEQAAPIDRTLHTDATLARQPVGIPRPDMGLGRTDIDDSLRNIDAPEEPVSKKEARRLRKQNRIRKPQTRTKRIIKWVAIVLAVILVGVGGFVLWRAFIAGNNVFQGNIFDLVQSQPLKEDANGRSNFVIFGTAEDDEGGEHGGANLTDSIMVISVDQDKKDAYMISLPRDLWVDYAETCTVGNQGKINAVYFCASNDGQDEEAGAAALQAKAGEILGLDIQYYVHMNFTAVVDAVDAVGGVEVTIQSEDPRGILDRNFDWKCNYQCYYVKYENGQKVLLDGEHALALARARNAQGGYGLPGGNFDREKNQQMIIKALREKAVSAGTLTNLGAVTGLIDALGNNLRTNIETKEIRTLMGLGNDIASDSIIPLTLVDEDEPLVTTGMVSGQSVVRPIAGVMNYREIQSYIKRNVNSSPITREEPHVTVLNGGRAAGVAGTESDRLSDEGFIIDVVDNAPDGTYARVEIYQLDETKTASAEKLAQLYGTTVKTTAPPVSVVGDSDFLIILGPEQ